MSRFVAAGLLLGGLAHATVPEKFGAGMESMALGNTGVAWSSDGHAAWHNPAGLSRMRRPSAGVGGSVGVLRFRDLPGVRWDTNRDGAVDELDTPLVIDPNPEDAAGVHFFAGRHIGGKFGLGISGYVPTRRVIEVRTTEPSLPDYFQYRSRLQRYVLNAGVGGQIVKGVHIGGGVDFVPRVAVDFFVTMDAAVSVDSGGDDLDALVSEVVIDVHEMDLEIIAGFAPILGVQLDFGAWSEPLEGLSLGVRWHGALGLPVTSRIDAQVNLAAQDIGDLEPYLLALVIASGVDLFDHYVPMTLTTGLSWRRPERPGLTLDVQWTDWRPMILSHARTRDAEVTSPIIRIDDAIVDGNPSNVVLRPTVAVRGGVEVPLPRIDLGEKWRYLDIRLRAGAGWEPTPLVQQDGTTTLLDSDRLLLSGGIGAEFWDPFDLVDGPVWFDAAFQVHILSPTELPRPSEPIRAGAPVGDEGFPVGGTIVMGGLQWGFQF